MTTKLLTQADIGARIRQARERAGMSQKDLAFAVGKDQKAISEYENGSRKMYAVELATFAQVLHVSISFFLPVEFETDNLDTLLLSEFHSLSSDADKQDLINTVRSIVQIAHRAR
jgi:transcriptional regulator with XRE-family HTH domain